MEGVAENLVELRKIKEGVIMSEDTDEEKQRVREKIEKRIRQQFDYQKRNMNDRFKNLGSISDMNHMISYHMIDLPSDWPS